MSDDAPAEESAAPPQPPTKSGVSRPPIELRVHGVSGTPPESLLDRPLVTQVGGDAIAGFYRPRLPEERTDDKATPFSPTRAKAPELEGYNWGGLTSGSPSRALWLFLLPFTLINIAPRARPVPQSPDEIARGGKFDKEYQHEYLRTSRGLTWLFSRWLALVLTLFLVVTTAGIGANLIGWQCSYSSACSGAGESALVGQALGHWEPVKTSHPKADSADRAGTPDAAKGNPVIKPVTQLHRVGGWAPEWLLLIGIVLPILMLFLLWYLSKRTIDRYELVKPKVTGSDPEEQDADDNFETNLDSTWMWHNQHQVRRIRATHMQAGFAAALWVGAEATASKPLLHLLLPWNWPNDWLTSIAAILLAVIVIYSFAVLMSASYVGHRELDVWQRRSSRVWWALIAAGVLLVLDLFTDDITTRGRPAVDAPASLPGFDGTLTYLVVFMFLITVATIVVVAIQAKPTPMSSLSIGQQRPLTPPIHGMAAGALASIAVLVAAIISASAFAVAAAWLNSGSIKPGPSQVKNALASFAVPTTFKMAVFVFLISVGISLLVAVVAGVRLWRGLAKPPVPVGAVARDYGSQDGAEAPARTRSIERAMYFGAMVERGLIALEVLVLIGVALTLAGGAFLLSQDGTVITAIRGGGKHSLLKYEAWGAYSAVLLLLGLVALTSLAFRVPATRKGVGIIWDVASFWPRSCHPLAAPCYAERTVPDLITRLDHYREEKRPVILAAHSQGTVISMAALSNLHGRRRDVDGISLLTFGCVLRRLYARFFPVYFGTDKLHQLQAWLTDDPEAGPRWINLWRYTDYLGGQVTAGPPQLVPEGSFKPLPNGLLTEPPSTLPSAAWEWHAPDPPQFDRVPGNTTYSSPSRHSNFWKDESGIFQLAVQRLVARHTPDPTTESVPPPPSPLAP